MQIRAISPAIELWRVTILKILTSENFDFWNTQSGSCNINDKAHAHRFLASMDHALSKKYTGHSAQG